VVIPDKQGPTIGKLVDSIGGISCSGKGTLKVSAIITYPSGVDGAQLSWQRSSFDYGTLQMSRTDDTFSATIIGLKEGKIWYRIVAWDKLGNTSESPEEWTLMTCP
jgi:hypothetical protein